MNLTEEVIDIPTPLGLMRTYLYRPSRPGKYPGLVLYSEIFQQTGPIKRSALRFASEGYLVAVPEVFHQHEPLGTVLSYSTEGSDKGNKYKYGTALATYDSDAKRVLEVLAGHSACSGKLGAVGFCLGGHLAFRAALHAGVAAAACFYATDLHSDSLGEGKQSDSLKRLKEVKGEVVFVWGRQDPHVPDAGRVTLLGAIRDSAMNFNWHEFNAVHAFMRDEGPRYDPALASLGYGLALELFGRVLR